MSKDYPAWVCHDCGIKYGNRGAWSLTGHIATFHMGKCGVCGKTAAVTEPRDYGHLRDGWQVHAAGAMKRRCILPVLA